MTSSRRNSSTTNFDFGHFFHFFQLERKIRGREFTKLCFHFVTNRVATEITNTLGQALSIFHSLCDSRQALERVFYGLFLSKNSPFVLSTPRFPRVSPGLAPFSLVGRFGWKAAAAPLWAGGRGCHSRRRGSPRERQTTTCATRQNPNPLFDSSCSR